MMSLARGENESDGVCAQRRDGQCIFLVGNATNLDEHCDLLTARDDGAPTRLRSRYRSDAGRLVDYTRGIRSASSAAAGSGAVTRCSPTNTAV